MAVSQTQVDHIIQTASADDPEVRLLKLQDEVELLKTSIKRLLIDIRERMNDLDNPLAKSKFGAGGGGGDSADTSADAIKSASGAVESAAGALKATTDLKKKEEDEARAQFEAAQAQAAQPAWQGQPGQPQGQFPQGQYPPGNYPPGTYPPGSYTPGSYPPGSWPPGTYPPRGPQIETPHQILPEHDEPGSIGTTELLALLQSRAKKDTGKTEGAGKVRLRKVFRLFEWTTRNVRRFGHDRVDLMLDSFHAMNYISDDSAKLVRDIARLMSTTLGENNEIRAEEYISELYELNSILDPENTALDREMIEVLMEQKGKESPSAGAGRRATEEETSTEFIRTRD